MIAKNTCQKLPRKLFKKFQENFAKVLTSILGSDILNMSSELGKKWKVYFANKNKKNKLMIELKEKGDNNYEQRRNFSKEQRREQQ